MAHALAASTFTTGPRPRARGFARPVSLAEVLDRVLTKGVVVAGEVVISVAGIDLVYLGVNVVLCSIETARGPVRLAEARPGHATSQGAVSAEC
jgi:hypothetical protein